MAATLRGGRGSQLQLDGLHGGGCATWRLPSGAAQGSQPLDGDALHGRTLEWRPPSGAAEDRNVYNADRLRLRADASQLIPGLTAHQAKGREWNHVGVLLTDSERETLAAGLVKTREDHRTLYVALTRAKHATRRVADSGPTTVAIKVT
ncbi:3'-5' exonuclease [Streptomyces sp. NPDC057062]|uniref:3'-5' exonuclease n=1 Tax=Streptomyces sp. NPDC057062 TaxID=3346011 RepID=UPI0036439F6B